MSVKPKPTTIEEFLANGGVIKKLPTVIEAKQPDVIKKPTAGGPVTILSLEEADLFYGEARKNSKPKKTKSPVKIDLSALPEALRSKFVNKLKEDSDDNEDDKENEEDSSEES